MRIFVKNITYLLDMIRTLSWKCLHITTLSFRTLSSKSTSSRNLLATISNASSGQAYSSKNNVLSNFITSFQYNLKHKNLL